jgi:plasmid stability protein
MGQLLIRNVDDRDLERLRSRAKSQRTSVEALARDAIRKEARPNAAERRAIVRDMQAWSQSAQISGMPQSLGVDLIREARDE